MGYTQVCLSPALKRPTLHPPAVPPLPLSSGTIICFSDFFLFLFSLYVSVNGFVVILSVIRWHQGDIWDVGGKN